MKKIFTVLMCVLTFALSSFAQNGWEKLKGPYAEQVNSIATGNSVVIAGTSEGFSRSTDDGLTWSEANNGYWGVNVLAVSYLNGFFFAGVQQISGPALLFRSDDNGDSWSQINIIDLTDVTISSFCKNDNYIFVGSRNKIFRSSDNGLHWTQTSYNIWPVTSMKCIGNNLFVGTDGGEICISTDNGDGWTTLGEHHGYAYDLAVFNGDLIVSFGSIVYKYSLTDSLWTTLFNSTAISYTYDLETNGSNIYYGTLQGLYMSSDGGANWDNLGLYTAEINSIGISNGYIIAGGSHTGIFTSTNNGTSWLETGILNNTYVQAIGIDGENLFSANNSSNGVFTSRNLGNSFVDYNNLDRSFAYCFHFSNSNVYVGTSTSADGASAIYKSTDYGHSWTGIGLANKDVMNIVENKSYLFAGTSSGMYRSSTDGAIWQQVNTGLTDLGINAVTTIDSIIFVGTNSGTFRSTNNGTSWTSYGLVDTAVKSMASLGTNLFAGTLKGIFISTESNPAWQQSGFQDTVIQRFANTASKLFAMTSSDLFYSDNFGSSWIKIKEDGLPNTFFTIFHSFAVNDSLIFLGTEQDGIWKSKLSDIITSTSKTNDIIVKDFKLNQNYPNPFNPSTKINYSIPHSGNVTLKVYDILGREVAILVNDYRSEGNYSLDFKANNLTSGIYFYELKTGNFASIKKMILLK